MTFCTSCGNKMEDGAKFCPACGARAAVPVPAQPNSSQPAGPSSAAASPAPSLSPQAGPVQPMARQGSGSGGGVIKVVLIIVVILVGLAVLSAAGLFWAAHKVKEAIRVEQNGNSASLKLPGFSASSNSDPNQVARELGVDVYPGAKAMEGASSVTMGSMTFGNVEFETSDPIDKVEQFYKVRFPRTDVSVMNQDTHTLLAMSGKGMVTITLERQGDRTKIAIARTAGREGGGSRGDSQ